MNRALSKREMPLHILMLPAVVVAVVFYYFPMVGNVIAFQDFIPSKGMGQFFRSEWIGFENFSYIFAMPDFKRVLVNTIVIAFYKIVLGIVVPLFLALLLNEVRSRQFKKSVQTILYIPYFLSWVILGGILIDLLSPTDGFVNTLIEAFGYKPVYFLGSNEVIQGVIISSHIWQSVGLNLVIFLAALTGIDPTLYEAATVDGASEWRRLTSITLPSLKPMIVLVSVLGLGQILNAGFDQVMNLYGPIVYEKADIIDTFVFRVGMLQLQYSVATAVGFFKSFVGLVFISASFYLARKFANYRLF